MNRYELRDVRNGSIVTSAIFDKQTGRVWTWLRTGEGKTYFAAETVYSFQDSPIPDPKAETSPDIEAARARVNSKAH